MDYENQEELHDENNDVVEEEAHNRMDAEVQSVKATAKAEDGTKQAPARKGDKRNGEKQPKTPAGKIGAMYDKMKGLSTEDLDVVFDKFMSEDYEDEDVAETRDIEVNADFTEDMDALVASEATLSEEFKEKTAIIFEAAIKSKVSAEVDRLEEEYATRIEEESAAVTADLVEKVDSYLNYVVEQWMEENELAIQQGLRTEIAENFMGSLKDLFEESYIDVPEAKIDLVDELADQVEDLEERLNVSVGHQIEMAEELESFQRMDIIRDFCEGLADTQIEKLASLVEDVDFEGPEAFAEKVKTIRESYFGKKAHTEDSSIVEESEGEDVKEVSGSMAHYVTALQNSAKK